MIQSKAIKRGLFLLSLSCWLLAFQPVLANDVPVQDFEKEMEKFRVFYKDALQENGIVGSSFMFIHDNKVLAEEFYGLMKKENNQKVDKNTIFHWASITKTFTGIAIMQLRDRGLLKLDDPIIKYIPKLRDVHNPFGDMSEITIRQLMSHSSGFRNSTWPWKNRPWQPHEPSQWEQLVAMFPYTEILFKPGSKYSYSNPGIIFLGRVIELLTTDDWEVYIDKNIFKPLEMYQSYFDATPYHLKKYKSQSYWLNKGKLTPAIPDVNTGITVSNGGLKCPFGDFLKYMNFLVGDERKQVIYDKILARSSLEEMWNSHVKIEIPENAAQNGNPKSFMGLIFFIVDGYGMHFIGHSGGQNAYVTHFFLNPSSRTAYVVAFNTHAIPSEGHTQDTRALDRKITDYLFKNIFPLFN